MVCLSINLIAQSNDNNLFLEIETYFNSAREQSADLLCPNEFSEAVNYYNLAKKYLAEGRESREIRTKLEWAVSLLARVNDKIEGREKVFATATNARKEALSVGADKYAVFYWSSAEEKLNDAVDDFSDQDFADIQKNISSIVFDYNKAKESAEYASFLIFKWEPLQNANSVLANLLSPNNYSNGLSKCHLALENLSEGEEKSSVNTLINDAKDLFNKSTEVSKKFIARYSDVIRVRKDASVAGAENYSVDLWKEGEEALSEAGLSFEKDKIEAAVENALTAKQKYLAAKHLAVRTNLFSKSDSLINLAIKEGAEETAPKSLAESNALINLGTEIIYSDQYDYARLRDIARLAETNASLAREINQTVENVEAGKTTWENLILDWNIYGYGRKDYTGKQSEPMNLSIENNRKELSADLKQIFNKANTVFNSDEAEIITNGDELIIRLIGIRYAWLSSSLTEEAKKILDKAIYVLGTAPFSTLTVAGHNDYIAAKTFNETISQERADNIREYILSSSNIIPSKISAIGYGETIPLTKDKSFAGRQKNIRTELIIK